MKKKILISDKLAKEGVDILKKNDDYDVVYKTGLSKEDLMKELKDASSLIIRSSTQVSEDIIDSSEKLQVIARAGVGLDNVDINKATEKGVIVMNAPGGNTISTAEHAIALMFSIARKIPMAHNSMKKQLWEKKLFQGIELRDKTIAIIGLGRIGKEVAKRCQGLLMRVIGFDPYTSKDKLRDLDIEIMELDDIWKEADFITVHTPLTDKTRNLITMKEISQMKQDVRLINCARGGIYNEQDLYEALKVNRIAGAALDVFIDEPFKNSPPFHELDNIVLTPHLGASTGEAQISVAIEAARNVGEFLSSGVVRNSVNFPSLEMREYNFLKPFIDLIEKMGSFHGSLLKGKINEINIFYLGNFSNHNLWPLTASYLKCLISPYTDFNVNFVNATVIAKEMGIKIQTGEDSECKDYSHLIKVKVSGDERTNELWGTILGRQTWFVKFNDYMIDFIPSGKMIVLHNNDVPNVVGSIGTFLGEKGINIANLHLARTTRGGKVLVIIEVDDDLSSNFLEQLNSIPEIIDVKYIVL